MSDQKQHLSEIEAKIKQCREDLEVMEDSGFDRYNWQWRNVKKKLTNYEVYMNRLLS